jgi:hypothetical protein
MRTLCAGLMALALLAAGPARAQDDKGPSLLKGGSTVPTFLHSTGLLLVPDANTVGDKGVSAHAYLTDNFNAYGFRVGPIDRLEISGGALDPESGKTQFIVNAKLKLLNDSLLWPGVAVGVVDMFDQFNQDPSWFIVASKGLPKILPVLGGLKVHLGYGGGFFGDEVFAGAELNLWTPLDVLPITHPHFSAIAEWVNSDVNVGLRARFRGFAATIAMFDLDQFGGGVSYTTGLRLW